MVRNTVMADLNPEVVSMVKDFVGQDDYLEAFLTGPAGAGKTTELRGVIEYLNTTNINYLVVAYTHKAKEVLQSKLPDTTTCKTLHSWLKKRPGINQKAKHIQALMTSRQQGKPDHLQLLIVDEFSFVGEDDYLSIGEMQDELLLTSYTCVLCRTTNLDDCLCTNCGGSNPLEFEEDSIQPLKVLYVGDLNQLSPIKGASAVRPIRPYWTKLTKIHRTTTTISEPLGKLVEMIEGSRDMKYLEPTENFSRKANIDKLYKEDKNDKIMLAFTNKAVELHNQKIQGYKIPKEGDEVLITTLRTSKTLVKITDTYDMDVRVAGGVDVHNIINMETKYKPLQYLNSLQYIKFYHFSDGQVVAGIFGSYQNKMIRERLGKKLVGNNANNKCSKAEYREYKTVQDFTCVMDFNHCMTIHKSQGSEFTNVYVDSADLGKCINKAERMKLLYVAMSRSTDSIFMNN